MTYVGALVLFVTLFTAAPMRLVACDTRRIIYGTWSWTDSIEQHARKQSEDRLI